MRKLFKDATIVDGMGNSAFVSDLLVEGSTIRAFGRLGDIQSDRIFDCRGLTLAPGFIDLHAHSEIHVLTNPPMGEKIAQGITTEFSGNCGIGVFPASRCTPLAAEVLGAAIHQYWPTFSSYKEAWYRSGSGMNMGFLQAHGPLRSMVLGEDAHRAATRGEIAKMASLLEESLERGAWGLSTGLYYQPCQSAGRDELVALSNVVARHNRLLAVHLRCEGSAVVESLDEMLDIARASGVRLEVSHLKAIGKDNQSLVGALLERIDRANDAGLCVGFDQYPYLWGSTSLFSLLPPSLLSTERSLLKERLRDPAVRREAQAEMERGEGWDSIASLVGFDDITILSLPSHPHYEGLSIAEVAAMRGQEPYDALFDLLSESEGSAVMGDVTQSEESLVKIMAHRQMCFGSDALYSSARPHPRSFHAALHLIGRYVNERGDLSIEEAIERLTGRTARRLGLFGRGLIAEGYKADLVLFDQDTLSGSDTFAEGGVSPLSLVMVNGEVALEAGRLVGTTSGRLLVPLTGRTD